MKKQSFNKKGNRKKRREHLQKTRLLVETALHKLGLK